MNSNNCLNSWAIMPPGDRNPTDSLTELHLCTTPKHLNSSGIQAWRPSVRRSSDYLSFNSTSSSVPVLQDEISIKFCKIIKCKVCVSLREYLWDLHEELFTPWRCEVKAKLFLGSMYSILCKFNTRYNHDITFVFQSGKKNAYREGLLKLDALLSVQQNSG